MTCLVLADGYVYGSYVMKIDVLFDKFYTLNLTLHSNNTLRILPCVWYNRLCLTVTVFWRCMSGQVLSSKRALERLQNYFITRESMVVSTSSTAPSSSGLIAGRHKGSSTSSGENGELVKSNTFTVLLLDEIDFLLTNDANVLYSFFNWPLMRQVM